MASSANTPKEYPKEITPKILEQNAHIADEIVQQDIADTEREIAGERAKLEANQILRDTGELPMAARRMAELRCDAARAGIADREAFVAFLKRLLEARKAAEEPAASAVIPPI